MNPKHRFDAEKTIEVLLYIAASVPDMYKALKVLYFADKEHLAQYGSLICGDTYVAMLHGPVASGAYDLVKNARGDGACFAHLPIRETFHIAGNAIVPLRQANLDLLSESDVECLDWAIRHYGHKSFGELKELSHDAAFAAADQNDFIPLETIISTLPDRESLLDYVANG